MRCVLGLLCFLMMTDNVSAQIVKSIGAGGTYDYLTVSAWEADSYGVLAGQDAVGQVYGTVLDVVRFNDNTPASIVLEAAPGQEHTGVPGTGATIRANGVAAIIWTDVALTVPITIRGLEVDRDGRDDAAHNILVRGNGGTTVERCLVYGLAINRSNPFAGINTIAGSTNAIIRNNIICNLSNAGTGDIAGIRGYAVTSHNVYNNTIANIDNSNASGAASGIDMLDDTDHAYKNNLVQTVTASGGGTATDYSLSTATLTVTSNNVSQDQTSPNSAYRGRTATFVNAAGNDFHLDTTDTAARGQGIGPTLDTDVPLDDIDRDPRSGTICDVGADEVAIVVSNVKSIGPGKDYPDVTAWEADSYGVIPSEHAVGQLYGMIQDNPFVADATPQSVTLEGAPGSRHNGTPGTGATIKCALDETVLRVEVGNTQTIIRWLSIDFDSTRSDSGQGIWVMNLENNCSVRNNVIHGMDAARFQNRNAIVTGGTSFGLYIANNIVTGLANSGAGDVRGIRAWSTGTQVVYNNTFAGITNSNASGAAVGIQYNDVANLTLKNNLVQDITASGGGTAADYSDSTATNATTGYNVSQDATSPDVSFRSQSAVFVNAAGGDYHLAAGDTVAINNGIGPTADSNVPLDDIDGDVRSGATEDIGADKYVAAVTTIIPILQRHYLGRRQQ